MLKKLSEEQKEGVSEVILLFLALDSETARILDKVAIESNFDYNKAVQKIIREWKECKGAKNEQKAEAEKGNEKQ